MCEKLLAVLIGLLVAISDSASRMLREDEVTLAQALKDAGYATGMFGKGHLGDNANIACRCSCTGREGGLNQRFAQKTLVTR